jgi:MoCo/4Fe-4S cofactor protein with predicted Tat translocation signal
MSERDQQHDLAPLRAQLNGKHGKEFWRSLEELAGTEKFQEFLHREFPNLNPSEWQDAVGRRQFLKLMGASLAFAGLTGCTVQPKEDLVPFVKPPEGIIPGKPLYYATAMTLGGIATGLLIESHEGRPTKVEGNPDHPASRGASDLFAQASVLTFYDPDRSKTLTHLGDVRTWGDFLTEIRAALDGQGTKRGAGLRILTETITSPTLAAQLQKLREIFPAYRWHQYEPAGRDGARLGAQQAFGQMVNTIYRFENAEVVLSLDADFLTTGPGSLRYAREFIAKRRLTDGRREMNRLYVVESALTSTGAKADHRWPMKASEVEAFARAVAAAVGVPGVTAPARNFDQARLSAIENSVARDLQQQRGKSIVIPGEHQPPAVHALAHAINHTLGNVGQTIIHTDPVEANPVDQLASLRELVEAMNRGAVDLLVIIGGNPVYDAPADLSFVEALKKVPLRLHLGLYNDETSEYCHWHIPDTHYLEAWGDGRAYDGTVSLIQPLIHPLYNGRSAHELLAVLSNQTGRTSYDLVREYWQERMGAGFEQAWRQALHDGVVASTALPAKTVALQANWAEAAQPAGGTSAPTGIEIVFRPGPCVYDGRFANNGWLQELPQPITKLTWDNVALLSPETAVKHALAAAGKEHEANGKQIRLTVAGGEITIPVWVMPGHAPDSITLHLGYGRTRAGKVGTGVGVNTYKLRTTAAPWFVAGAQLEVTGERVRLASTQEHFNIDASGLLGGDDLKDRSIIREAALATYQQEPDFAHHLGHQPAKEMTIYPDEHKSDGYAWGMTIDQMACIGCNACVVACQAENNIAIVGKQQVMNGREMHWLRIDTYFKGALAHPRTYFQPMLCQHCENAPCEVVCPVNATVHDAEGLNVQVYNRCVGTRYCSNNCPYKVRRFNFLLYGDWTTPSLKMMRNPDVSVRSRGVMEKCTFCVQRIMEAKIEAEKQDRQVRDGEIKTACQQTCPTEAIIFGNINDRESRVARLKAEPRNYQVLAELNVRPRTSYLALVRNPHPELEPPGAPEAKHG